MPSGVYLVDTYQHVHTYAQQMRPGPYVADGYKIGMPAIPIMDVDLALPSLSETEARISASLKVTNPMRALVDSATLRDVLKLVDLLKARSKHDRCSWPSRDAIAQTVTSKLLSFDDPHLLLQIYPLTDGFTFNFSFISPIGKNPATAFTDRRLRFLIEIMSSTKSELSLRIAAIEILSFLSKFGSPPQTNTPSPTENRYLGTSEAEVCAAAKKIVDDDSDRSHLRAMCVHLLRVADLRSSATSSTFTLARVPAGCALQLKMLFST